MKDFKNQTNSYIRDNLKYIQTETQLTDAIASVNANGKQAGRMALLAALHRHKLPVIRNGNGGPDGVDKKLIEVLEKSTELDENDLDQILVSDDVSPAASDKYNSLLKVSATASTSSPAANATKSQICVRDVWHTLFNSKGQVISDFRIDNDWKGDLNAKIKPRFTFKYRIKDSLSMNSMENNILARFIASLP